MKTATKRGLSAVAIALAAVALTGCGGNSPDPDRVFDSKSDAEQYALKYYCKADSAEREFGVDEKITCDNGTVLTIVRVWDDEGNADGYRIETLS